MANPPTSGPKDEWQINQENLEMNPYKKILSVSLLTLALSSVAMAGDISGRSISRPGDISGRPGDISGKPGDISGLKDLTVDAIVGLINALVP